MGVKDVYQHRSSDNFSPLSPTTHIELTGEAQCRRAPAHSRRDNGVEVLVLGVLLAQRTLANVVEGLIVHAEGQVCLLDELVEGQRRIVGLDDGIRHLGGRQDAPSAEHTVRELLSQLGEEVCSQT